MATFNVGDGIFKRTDCDAWCVCRGAPDTSCLKFSCKDSQEVYGLWRAGACTRTPGGSCVLSFWDGAKWVELGRHAMGGYFGYVWVSWTFGRGNCGYAYRMEYAGFERFFVVGDVPFDRLPCELWTDEIRDGVKTKIKADIAAEKEDAKEDIAAVRERAKEDTSIAHNIESEATAAERAEAKRDLAVIEDHHDSLEADIRAARSRDIAESNRVEKEEQGAARAEIKHRHDEFENRVRKDASDSIDASNVEEKTKEDGRRAARDAAIVELRRIETETIADIKRKRDEDVADRYASRDRRIEELKKQYEPCYIY